MCIYYRTTFTNKRVIWNNKDNVLTHFKCGHCFECMQERTNEMIYRGYWEAKETFNKNGYTIFDTLTYSNEHVPTINNVLGLNLKHDFYCFRHSDIINFLKLLRIRLTRRHKENGTLKVMYTGEYGTDQNCTHRPHIHIIFYYTGKLKPEELSYLISDCWSYGRTDGIKYKGYLYFHNKRLFTSQNVYNLNQTKYICKYLQKESNFDYTIKQRCRKIIKEYKKFEKDLDYFDKLEVNKLLNSIRQFSRISNNFGSYAVNYIDWNKIKNGDTLVTMPDNKNVVKRLNLPKYYIRRELQNLVYYNIGNEVFTRWEWNSSGQIFIKNKNIFNLSNNVKKIRHLSESMNIKLNNVNDLAFYETNKGKLLNNTYKYLINYNLPKYKTLYNKDIQLTNKPIDNDNVEMIYFKDLSYIKDVEYDELLNSMKVNETEIGKERHKRYLRLFELNNKYKFLGLK